MPYLQLLSTNQNFQIPEHVCEPNIFSKATPTIFSYFHQPGVQMAVSGFAVFIEYIAAEDTGYLLVVRLASQQRYYKFAK